jgi:hypothetical protein
MAGAMVLTTTAALTRRAGRSKALGAADVLLRHDPFERLPVLHRTAALAGEVARYRRNNFERLEREVLDGTAIQQHRRRHDHLASRIDDNRGLADSALSEVARRVHAQDITCGMNIVNTHPQLFYKSWN